VLRAIKQAGCSHLVYGYESFSPRVMKTIGKGATPEANARSLRWTLEAGIRPIPNQMMGFPDEDFDSLRDNVLAWNQLGLQVKPFFATPYPGTEWYQHIQERILEQYGGDLEAFLLDVGDATRVTAVISKKFNAVELYGLRELMVLRDLRRLEEYEKEWNRLHPSIPGRGERGVDQAIRRHREESLVKLTIIGLGSIGRRHLGNFHSIGVESLSAYDAAPAAREAAAAQFPYAKIASTLEAALDGAQGVIVGTPPDSHLAIARMAVERGQHLMIEKPLTQTVDGVEAVLRAADAKTCACSRPTSGATGRRCCWSSSS
jgi:hypothetical protein